MFDLCEMRAEVARHGRVVRVVIAEIAGSSPREVGAAMLVWRDAAGRIGQSGTIGGGALEYRAAAEAGAMLASGQTCQFERAALGPALGQCCGGTVALLSEIYDAEALAALEGKALHARRVLQRGPLPLSVKRLIAAARSKGETVEPQLLQGWMVEPLARPKRKIWIWGAGHVGRALVGVLAPLPEFEITWVDTARERFPEEITEGVTPLWSAGCEALAGHAPQDAEHLILTYSHALDLELCHRLLSRGFASLGLIGSKTKWARFRSRLAALGHSAAAISRITCPIGDPSLGKHPQAIALGVAVELLRDKQKSETEIADDQWHDPGHGARHHASRDPRSDQDLSRRGCGQ